MLVERIERYRLDGKEFDDLTAVKKYVENEVGKIIDSAPRRIRQVFSTCNAGRTPTVA